jgi:hypothetical protein
MSEAPAKGQNGRRLIGHLFCVAFTGEAQTGRLKTPRLAVGIMSPDFSPWSYNKKKERAHGNGGEVI